jgi:hypothetical protein
MAALSYARIWRMVREIAQFRRTCNKRPDRLRQVNLPRLTNLFRRLPYES